LHIKKVKKNPESREKTPGNLINCFLFKRVSLSKISQEFIYNFSRQTYSQTDQCAKA